MHVLIAPRRSAVIIQNYCSNKEKKIIEIEKYEADGLTEIYSFVGNRFKLCGFHLLIYRVIYLNVSKIKW